MFQWKQKSLVISGRPTFSFSMNLYVPLMFFSRTLSMTGVDVLIDIFEEEREAVLDGQLQLLQEIRIVECANLRQTNGNVLA